ncbi:hypothetical protein GGI43DRAFT_205033 [Trichoderma evansii]
MVQFGRWTLCRSDDLSCMGGNIGCLCSVFVTVSVPVQHGLTLAFLFFIFTSRRRIAVMLTLQATLYGRQASNIMHGSRLAVGWLNAARDVGCFGDYCAEVKQRIVPGLYVEYYFVDASAFWEDAARVKRCKTTKPCTSHSIWCKMRNEERRNSRLDALGGICILWRPKAWRKLTQTRKRCDKLDADLWLRSLIRLRSTSGESKHDISGCFR